MPEPAQRVLEAAALDTLIRALQRRNYRVIAPTVRDAAIILDEIQTSADLPVGFSDEQAPGRYRIAQYPHRAFFAFGNGPQSWKKFLHPAECTLFAAARNTGHGNGNGNGSFRILGQPETAQPMAFLGVHACDLNAIAILERSLTAGGDSGFAARRAQTFIVALQCQHAGGDCFCAGMKTGSRLPAGFDLALTEFHGPPHRFLIQCGSERGREVLAELDTQPASAADIKQNEDGIACAAAEQTRTLDSAATHALLDRAFDSAYWGKIAARCLACGNCTMVCPTCFCTAIEDASNVPGDQATRCRHWDSCFTPGFSYIHGGSIRTSLKSRYRQWLMHKLSAWVDQFGTHGCVGCGRCLTWCPVGIDITAEFHAFQEAQHGNP